MAKALFHKHQRVWVESVGAWAVVEKLIPVWAKGFDEPVRLTYDVGLGREFQGHELAVDAPDGGLLPEADGGGEWRLLRARNKWQTPEDCSHHPHPGTFPVVVSDPNDWGGWRVPGAEYDRDPWKIEIQARLIASAPKLMTLVRDLAAMVKDSPEDFTPDLLKLAKGAAALQRYVDEEPLRATPTSAVLAAA